MRNADLSAADIFVSYRRADSAGAAGRLCDHLNTHFGAGTVFRDVESIDAGEDFDRAIRDALRVAAVVIVVIGPRWIDARDAAGRRRLEDPRDYVRREIEIALASDVTIIPVLVDGALPPAPAALPDALAAFGLLQCVDVSDRRWSDDVRALVARISEVLGEGRQSLAPPPDGDGPGRLARLRAYPGELGLLVKAPRRLLVRKALSRRDRLADAFVFFGVSVVLSDATVTGVYWPRDSAPAFLFSGFALTLVATIAISAPLWLAWRLVGARRHFAPLFVILLYQIGAVHLVVVVAVALALFVVELRSLDAVSVAMSNAMRTGASFEVALSAAMETLALVLDSRTIAIVTTICTMAAAAAVVFLARSWGAYRDAFGVSRRGSVTVCLVLSAAVALVLLMV